MLTDNNFFYSAFITTETFTKLLKNDPLGRYNV